MSKEYNVSESHPRPVDRLSCHPMAAIASPGLPSWAASCATRFIDGRTAAASCRVGPRSWSLPLDRRCADGLRRFSCGPCSHGRANRRCTYHFISQWGMWRVLAPRTPPAQAASPRAFRAGLMSSTCRISSLMISLLLMRVIYVMLPLWLAPECRPAWRTLACL